MMNTPLKYKLILASNSPRRRELLSGLGLDFEVRVLPGIDESHPAELQGGDIPLFISKKKADAYVASLQPDELLITADTIVWLDGEVLEKPKDEADACRMLHELSGKTHQVFTGVCLTTTEKQVSFSCRSDVTFCQLTDEEINHYVQCYRPLDKAGAYGVQEWIGYVGVERIEGSFFNVVGLPVQRLYQALKQNFKL
ncbi:MAG: Maf-like protein [Bacteroidaceae bacterium]|nr:Maf-like protein [Bacteroidaceae bacterium]